MTRPTSMRYLESQLWNYKNVSGVSQMLASGWPAPPGVVRIQVTRSRRASELSAERLRIESSVDQAVSWTRAPPRASSQQRAVLLDWGRTRAFHGGDPGGRLRRSPQRRMPARSRPRV